MGKVSNKPWWFVVVVFVISGVLAADQLRMNPALDYFNLEHYFRHGRLWNVQRKCLFERGPCDIVGRWLKPRLAKALMGYCEMCTESQTFMITNLVDYLKYEQPDIYEMAIKSFLTDEQLVLLVKSAVAASSTKNYIRPKPVSQDIVYTEVISGSSDETDGPENLVEQSLDNAFRNRRLEPKSKLVDETTTQKTKSTSPDPDQDDDWENFKLLTTPKSRRAYVIPILPKEANES